MKTKHLSAITLALATALSAAAAPVDQDAALKNVFDFLSTSSSPSLRKAAAQRPDIRCVSATGGHYVFNVGHDGGYVIASASDRTQAVLGYSDEGVFDPANMPDALRAWLTQLDDAVATLDAGRTQAKALNGSSVAAAPAKAAIAPMVTARWNQGDPFNIMTPPYVNQDNGQRYEHSVTGCVATATTQIMYYWKWPQAACTAIPSYTYNWLGNNVTMPQLPPVVFNWDAMTDTYSGSSSQESKEAVAQLMLYAGCGMESGYAQATGATSVNALRALQNYFGYSRKAYNAYHLNYTFSQWEDLFYNELAAGRPLLMGADNYERTGGHEFICDGYDGKGLYHINWGWGGYCDGYFVLTVMAPDSQGIGGSTDANGYSMGQNVIVNLRPAYDEADEEVVRASISGIRAGQSSLKRDADGNVSLNFTYDLRTLLLDSYELDFGFRLSDASGAAVGDVLGAAYATFRPSDRYGMSASLTFGAGLAPGEYVLRGVSRRSGTTEWLDDHNSDRSYISLTVDAERVLVAVMPGGGRSLKVNAMKLEGRTVKDQWQRVVYTITNSGDDFYGETYMFVDGKRRSGNTISIPAGETVDVYYKFQPDAALGTHRFVLSTTTSPESGAISTLDRMYNIDCQWNADGTVKALPVSTATQYEVPAEASAVYLYGATPRTVVVKDANPNLVMYLDADAEVSSRVLRIYRNTISNIVYGDTAEVAVIRDGHALSVPKPFVAREASYTRADVAPWSTVFLPFEVQRVTVDDDTDADWFTSAEDTGKSLFIKTYSGCRRGRIIFVHAAKVPARTPLFVGARGNLGGSAFDHTGHSLTFSGTDVTVSTEGRTTDNTSVSGTDFLGCFGGTTKAGVFGLNDTCDKFVKTSAVEPFRAYFTDNGYDEYTIRFDEGEEEAGVAVVEAVAGDPDAPVYNMQGIRVGTAADLGRLPAGLYICGGRKILKR